MLKGLAVLAAAAIATTGLASGVEINRCIIEVDGHAYLDGPCEFNDDTETGVITLGVGDKQSSRFFAYVIDGSRAFWNGKDGDSHAGYDLGTVALSGQCWQNASAKICAYTDMGLGN